VLDGYIRVGCNIRILRGIEILYEGKLQARARAPEPQPEPEPEP